MPEQNIHEPAWFFRLNELDLLEFDYNALYHDERGRERRLREVEEEVLHEQELTDEAAQAELLALFPDLDDDDDDVCPIHGDGPCPDDDQPVAEMLRPLSAGDALCRETFRFARSLIGWASVQQAAGENYRHLFRLRANLPVIAAKVTFAGEEERRGDRQSAIIACTEYEVAGIFLSRVMESLDALAKAEFLPQSQAVECQAAAFAIMQKIKHKVSRLCPPKLPPSFRPTTKS